MDFIEKLIEPNLKRRMTVEQALQHPWIAQETESEKSFME
jgi:serine/threonine protein kinase